MNRIQRIAHRVGSIPLLRDIQHLLFMAYPLALIATVYSHLRINQKPIIVIPKDGMWLVKRGKLRFYIPHPALALGISANTLDNFEQNENFERYIKIEKGDLVFDCGAGVGRTAVMFARRTGKTGHVVSMESDKATLKCLKANIELMGCQNITVVEKGVYGYPTENRDSLDNIARKLGIGKIDFLAMDIEGDEICTLIYGAGMLANTRKVVICGYHELGIANPYFDMPKKEKTCWLVQDILRRYGFQTAIDEEYFVFGWRE